jgi:hypothetical protein
MAVEKARLEDVGSGLAPVGPGWFVVNVAEAAWLQNEAFGGRCVFESNRRVLQDRPAGARAADVSRLPPGTRHTFVGTGDGPCVIFMVGARREDGAIVHPESRVAQARGAGVATETNSPHEAYAPFGHWRLGRPDASASLPWK